MSQNKKSFILLGLAAAYVAYRYSKMTPEDKDSLKEKGRKLAEDYLPADIKNMLGLKTDEDGAPKEAGAFKNGF